MDKKKIGVLVMSYGTPASLDQVEEYYTHIRRGNPPTAEQLKTLTDRYEAIVGGFFPLRANTDQQVRGVEATLNEQYSQSEYDFVCYQGLKHARPYIEDGVQAMAEDGVSEAIGVVLAPHYSVMSVGSYIKRAEAEAEKQGVKLKFVKSYHLHPKLIEALTQRVKHSLEKFSDRSKVKVLFTAHSLPEKILESNDPYPEQLLETSRVIAQNAGVEHWQFAWQSAGQTREPWLGPDLLDVMKALREEEQVTEVLVCPVGFVSDHLEVLYDLDIEAQQVAKEIGMHLERTASLNSDPLYLQTISEVVYTKLTEE